MLSDEEIWKDIKGYEGLYEVSNLGQIRSLDRYKNTKGRYGIIKAKIEELKDESKEYQIGFAQGCYEKDLDWKDKIEAKIQEVEQWELYNMKIPRLSTLDERLGAKIGIKYVLQSLLEKE